MSMIYKLKRYMYYFVYKTTNLINDMIYVGYHSTKKLKDGYKGSGVELKKAFNSLGRKNFKIKILKYFDNKHDMRKYESIIVNSKFIKRKDTYNKILGGGGWDSVGKINNKMVIVIDTSGNKLKVKLDDPRYLSGELVSINKGKIQVIDLNNKRYSVYKDDPRYLSGELIVFSKNKITVKDQVGKTFQISKDDPRYLSGELVGINTGKITVKDQVGKTFQISKDDPRYLSGELKHVAKGLIVVKDKKNNALSVSKDDPRYLSGELVGIKKYISNKGRICSIETKLKISKSRIEYYKKLKLKI